MSVIEYDPVVWLESLTRSIGSYVKNKLNDPDTDVEMSWPDTANWTKENPLGRALIHFEQDDMNHPTLGFGTPGVFAYDDLLVPATVVLEEAAQHLVNFDVGVWVSAETGGATKRMELMRKLSDIFATSTGKQDFNDVTNGLWPVSFNGGGNHLDRINDLPIWRGMGMTLIVRAFSRYVPATPEIQIGDFEQDPGLTIVDPNGIPIVIDNTTL